MLYCEVGIGISCPLRNIGKVICGHCGCKLNVPSCERVTDYGERGSFRKCSAISYCMGYAITRLISVGVGYVIRGSYVVNLDNSRSVCSDYTAVSLFEDCFFKCLLEVCAVYSVTGCAILRFSFCLGITIVICVLIVMLYCKCSIGISCPLRIVCEIRCGHYRCKLAIPSCEGITNYGEFRSFRKCCTVSYGVRFTFACLIAVGKRYCVGRSVVVNLDDSASVCLDRLRVCTLKNDTRANHCGKLVTIDNSTGNSCSVVSIFEGVIIVICILYVMLNLVLNITCCPFCINGNVLGRHRSGDTLIPTCKYVSVNSE